MAAKKIRHLASSTLLVTEEVSAAEALALASMPGACEADRYAVFVEMEETYAKGSYARIEFILPGKPGRWAAAGEVTCEVKAPIDGVPKGICMELLGLTLTTGQVEASPEPETVLADVASTRDGAAEHADDTEGDWATDSSKASAPDSETDDPDLGEPKAATDIKITSDDVCGMLGDLLGREVKQTKGCKLPGKIEDSAVVAIFRDDKGKANYAITLDKGGATRIGGALTMLPEAAMNNEAESESMLMGDPLENVSEVLSIMSSLFQESHPTPIVLAEVIHGAELREYNDGEFVEMMDNPSWSLAYGMEIEDCGKAEIYLAAL